MAASVIKYDLRSNERRTFSRAASEFESLNPLYRNGRSHFAGTENILKNNFETQGGGVICIDLSKVPKEVIFPQYHAKGKSKMNEVSKWVINIYRNKEVMSDSKFVEQEIAAAKKSAVRNREVHLGRLPREAIVGWKPYIHFSRCLPIKFVTAPLIYTNSSVTIKTEQLKKNSSDLNKSQKVKIAATQRTSNKFEEGLLHYACKLSIKCQLVLLAGKRNAVRDIENKGFLERIDQLSKSISKGIKTEGELPNVLNLFSFQVLYDMHKLLHESKDKDVEAGFFKPLEIQCVKKLEGFISLKQLPSNKIDIILTIQDIRRELSAVVEWIKFTFIRDYGQFNLLFQQAADLI